MTQLSPRKQPTQVRARASCAAIEEATARILTERGPGALNTNRIAAVAGVSVGTLYQYYPSKEAILAGMIRRMRAEMLADIEAAVASGGADLMADVDRVVRASLAHHARAPTLAIALERVEADLALDSETQALKARIHERIAALLARHRQPEPARAAVEVSALVRAMSEVALAEKPADTGEAARRISAAVIGYLGAD